MAMIFVTLPVRDLGSARAFYGALGFRIEENASDQRSVAVVVDSTITVRLMSREAFAELVPGQVGDPTAGTTVVNVLAVDSRAEVDDLVARAASAGGSSSQPVQADEASYTGGFTDPDGHAWRVTAMEPVHVID
jgi:predicted lactoylglutathione lyase